MELDSRKKSRRDRMMRSNSFETQEVREIGRKEAGESRGFPILWMGIMEGASRSGNVSLAIFITSVSGSKSPASFTNRFFHLSRPPDFRMVFDAAERNERFGRIQCQRGKESSSRGKRKRGVFLCRRTVRVKVGGKVIPASFLKIEGRGTLVEVKDRR